jgi:hypothetical protein
MTEDPPERVADASEYDLLVVAAYQQTTTPHLPANDATVADPEPLCSSVSKNDHWRGKRPAVLFANAEICGRCQRVAAGKPEYDTPDGAGRSPEDILRECGFEDAAATANARSTDRLIENGGQP